MMNFKKNLFVLILLLSVLSFKSPAQNKPGFAILKERNGLPHFFDNLKRSMPVTIGYLGGSITEAPGYRVKTEHYFRQHYPGSAITAINAGVGGTGSSLGVFRLQEEVLSQKPDLVFIEFAVNDAASDSLLVCRSVEGIVRQIKKQNLHTDICFLYTIHEPMTETYNAGELFRSIRFMERIADHYKLPSINLGVDVMTAVNRDGMVFHGNKEDEGAGKKVFSYDGTHPGDFGHGIYTSTIIESFRKMTGGKPMKVLPASLYPGNFEVTRLLSPNDVLRTAGWKKPGGESYLQPFLKAYPGLIFTSDTSDSVVIRFKGTYFGFCDIIGPSAAPALIVTIDGNKELRPRFDSYGFFYRRSYCLIGPLKDGEHVVTMKKDASVIDKLKMINYHETKCDPRDYQKDYFFLGRIMIIGTL